MDILITLSIVSAVLFIVYVIYDKAFRVKYKETYLVQYGEQVGKDIVYHTKLYKASTTKDGNSIKIYGLNIFRPNPPVEVLEQTNSKDKLFALIKIDVDRFVFRKSSISNEVFTYKKDSEGKIIYDNKDRPILNKKSWIICDDYVEQNVKHWERLRNKEIEEKHKLKSKWAEWQPLIFIAVGLFVFIMVIKFSYDVYEQHTNIMAGKMDSTLSEADKLLGQIDRLMGTVTNTTTVQGQSPTGRTP